MDVSHCFTRVPAVIEPLFESPDRRLRKPHAFALVPAHCNVYLGSRRRGSDFSDSDAGLEFAEDHHAGLQSGA